MRPATAEDAASIARVRILTWRKAYRDIVDRAYLDSLSIEAAQARLAARMSSEPDDGQAPLRFVAVMGDDVAGFCRCGVQADGPFTNDWFLHALYVLPEKQGLGIGKALVHEALDEGRRRGAKRMVFGVFTANEESKRFYFGTGARFIQEGNFEIEGRSYRTDYCEYLID